MNWDKNLSQGLIPENLVCQSSLFKLLQFAAQCLGIFHRKRRENELVTAKKKLFGPFTLKANDVKNANFGQDKKTKQRPVSNTFFHSVRMCKKILRRYLEIYLDCKLTPRYHIDSKIKQTLWYSL